MPEPILRALRPDEWDAVAEVVWSSTNAWYQRNRGVPAFAGGPETCRLFPEVYEGLDPGHCVVAEDPASGRLMGSCFYRRRETHVSLGILNVHPDFFGCGVAGRVLRFVTDFADHLGLPVRLVSSAMNLDSFSLYSRAGFVPRGVFATMMVGEPKEGEGAYGLAASAASHSAGIVRPIHAPDVDVMGELELRTSHIRRTKDYALFAENRAGIWHTLVHTDVDGRIDGWLASVAHPASTMIGPGVMANQASAAALLAAQVAYHRALGRTPMVLVPTWWPGLVSRAYAWGLRNVEVHVAQVRGKFDGWDGVVIPTFMPETG